jgi:DNA-binding NtrC family response regulator
MSQHPRPSVATTPSPAMPDAPTLLVVDDEPRIRVLVERIGRDAGFAVVARGGGREAIADLPALRPAVALVDLQMPEVDGLEALRTIREADPHCQVVLMTGHASIDVAIEAVKMGAIDYLAKPFNVPRLRRLLASVRENIDRRQGGGPSPQEV